MKVKRNESFFDEISIFYDGMIDFGNALKRRQELLGNFIDTNIKTAADLGCGSGLDSIALAKNGIEVTAFDQSKGMISRAMENAGKENVEVRFLQTSLDKIPKAYNNKFDLVFSMGNTLANLEPSKLTAAFEKIYTLLKGNGKAVIQILNYYAILKNKERIINITDQNENMFIRFYDFHPEHLKFNILTFKKDNPKERVLYTTKLYPYDYQTFSGIVKQSGFRNIKIYGSLNLDKFLKSKSGDLVMIAVK